MVSVTGKIKFPGQYELKEDEGLGELLKFSGGNFVNDKNRIIEIVRVNKEGKKERINANDSTDSTALKNGDVVNIFLPSHGAETVTVEGALYGKNMPINEPFLAPTSGIKLEIPYYPGISLLNVLDMLGGPTPYAKTEITQIISEDNHAPLLLDIEPLWKTREKKLGRRFKSGRSRINTHRRKICCCFWCYS